MDEHQLIQGCQRGDRAAFRQLFDTYKDRVHSIALNFCGNDSTAQDITQEVFIKLFRTIGQFRHQASFATWLYRVVVNTCLNEERKSRKFVPLATWNEGPALKSSTSPEREYSQRELADLVRAAVASLDVDLRMPLVLRYMEDLSYAEIAETLDCSIGTVSSRLNRAHRMLGRKLSGFRDKLP